MSPDSFIDNDGAFLYRPDTPEFFYILDLPDTVEISDRPALNITGNDDIITTSWDENNEHILFSVNERPFDGTSWFSFYVIFDVGGGQTLTRGGSITIVDDSTRLVWNHDRSLDSFSESFSSIEHFMFDHDRSLTYKHLLIIEEGDSAATWASSSGWRNSDDWPVFVPAPGSRTPSDAVTIRPVNIEEVSNDQSLHGMWVISVDGWAAGEIVLTIDETIYSLPVLFEPPEIGFSRSPSFASLNDVIVSFPFNPEDSIDTFYYILPTALNTRGLNRNNIEVLVREDLDADFITAVWGRNNRSVRFTVNNLPQSPVQIAFGLTNNALGQIYGNIYHSSIWLEIVDGG
jgi:hypothetical protein